MSAVGAALGPSPSPSPDPNPSRDQKFRGGRQRETAIQSALAPVRWLMARGRRASGVAAAPRSRAAGAPATRRRRPWEARARAARVQTAGEDLWWVVVRTPTPNYLRQASPDRGKYDHSSYRFSLRRRRPPGRAWLTAPKAPAEGAVQPKW